MWPVFSHSSLKSYKARICTDRIYHKVSKTLFFFFFAKPLTIRSPWHLQAVDLCCSQLWHMWETPVSMGEALWEEHIARLVCLPQCGPRKQLAICFFGEWGGLCPQIVSVNMRQRLDRSAENKWQSYRLRNICTYFLKDSLYFMIYAGCGRVHR